MDSLSRDWASNVEALNVRVRKGSSGLFVWLAKTLTKGWPTLGELEMLDVAWFM